MNKHFKVKPTMQKLIMAKINMNGGIRTKKMVKIIMGKLTMAKLKIVQLTINKQIWLY